MLLMLFSLFSLLLRCVGRKSSCRVARAGSVVHGTAEQRHWGRINRNQGILDIGNSKTLNAMNGA